MCPMDLEIYKMDLNARCGCGCMDGKRVHNIYRFPNDCGASVISGPRGLKGARPGFRMYILRFETPAPEHACSMIQDTPLAADLLECADWGEVEVQLRKVCELPPAGFIALE